MERREHNTHSCHSFPATQYPPCSLKYTVCTSHGSDSRLKRSIQPGIDVCLWALVVARPNCEHIEVVPWNEVRIPPTHLLQIEVAHGAGGGAGRREVEGWR